MAARATGCAVGGGSLLPAGLIICAISGWLCFLSRILVISWVKAAGSSTNALASASGLSRTMAKNISPPSFWMRAGRPACICSRIATALFSHKVRSHSFSEPLASPTRDERTVRERGGWQVCDSSYCTANVTLFYFIGRGRFARNGRLGVSPQLPQCVSMLRFHIFPVPHCVMRPLGCFVIYFYWISSAVCDALPHEQRK